MACSGTRPTSPRSPPSGRSRCFRPSGRRWSGRSSAERGRGSATCRLRRCWLRRVAVATLSTSAGQRGSDPDDPARDPLGTLAAAAGYDDPERWWEDIVESRVAGSSPFPLLVEAMGELRRHSSPSSPTERRREAYMRQRPCCPAAGPEADRRGLRRLARAGADRPLPPANTDAAVLRGGAEAEGGADLGAMDRTGGWPARAGTGPGSPRPAGTTTYSSRRSEPSPAGWSRSPECCASGTAGLERPRDRGGPAGRDAGHPAGRPLAGLTEVTEATRAVLCDGDDAGGPLRHRAPGGRRRPWARSPSGCRPFRW